MAGLSVVIDDFIRERELDATALQCWTAIQEYYGISPCAIMSMMSDSLKPSACEVDVTGALTMYAMQLASDSPSALLDWNNNYADHTDKCVFFHCSNLPRSFFSEVRMDFHEIIAGDVGKENTYGTCVGRIKSGPMTFARFSTDDTNGALSCYIGQGRFTDDPFDYGMVTGVEEPSKPDKPESFVLHQNRPNPFNPFTSIEYTLPKGSYVKLEIYNSSGQLIAKPVDEYRSAGTHMASWKASNHASGTYFFRFRYGGYTETKKMMLLR